VLQRNKNVHNLESHENTITGGGKTTSEVFLSSNPDGVAHGAVSTYPDKHKFNMA
jgi:hypothetical protein